MSRHRLIKSPAHLVKEFYKTFAVPAPDEPTINIPNERVVLRVRLITEEFNELAHAMANKDKLEIADGLCDLLYVVYGTAVEYGLTDKLHEMFEEVHRSNMSKLDSNGQPVMREDGKVLKSELFTPPNLSQFL